MNVTVMIPSRLVQDRFWRLQQRTTVVQDLNPWMLTTEYIQELSIGNHFHEKPSMRLTYCQANDVAYNRYVRPINSSNNWSIDKMISALISRNKSSDWQKDIRPHFTPFNWSAGRLEKLLLYIAHPFSVPGNKPVVRRIQPWSQSMDRTY